MADYLRGYYASIQEICNRTAAAIVCSPYEGCINHTVSEYMLDDGFKTLLKKNELLFLKDQTLLTKLSYL
jgi:hypothetical protein